MTATTAYSKVSVASAAVDEIAAQLADKDIRLLLFFASPRYDVHALSSAIEQRFAGVPAIGCTTAGELVDDKMLNGSVVAMALDSELLSSARVAVVADAGSEAQVEAAMQHLGAAAGGTLAQLDPSRYVGLVLHDGLAGHEESVMSQLSTASNVPFVGGSAGDDRIFEQTTLFCAGSHLCGGAVLALLEPRDGYRILKTQSFGITDQVLEVTEVDEGTRTVRAFNGKPAAQEYARMLQVLPTELADHFISRPLGLVLPDGEPFVRSPMQCRGDDIVFYCQVKQGMPLRLLESQDIVSRTREDLQYAVGRNGGCRAVINFHCILRTLELEAQGRCGEYGEVFAEYPTVGFSTYGESYVGHINQTSTMLLLK